MIQSPRIKPIERATNQTWDEWIGFMDSIKAKKLDHQAIATKAGEMLVGKLEHPA